MSFLGVYKEINLPKPKLRGTLSLEEALFRRRSIRKFNSKPLSLDVLSQLLWSAQGKTGKRFGRTAPSAGALYPIEMVTVVGNMTDLESGLYLYLSKTHKLQLISKVDVRREIAVAAVNQSFIGTAPVVIVIAAHFSVTASKYGNRAERYVYMEAGHVSQNLYLECTSLSLGTCAVGAFYDNKLKRTLKIKSDPLYIMPIGYY